MINPLILIAWFFENCGMVILQIFFGLTVVVTAIMLIFLWCLWIKKHIKKDIKKASEIFETEK